MESGKITQSESVEVFEVSRSKIKKDRKDGLLSGEQDETGRKTWRYAIEDLDKLYRRRELDLDADQGPELDMDRFTLLASSTAGPELIETEIRLEYTERDLNQRTAERDRARSDHEQEKGERKRLEREAIQLKAELDAARTIASDRTETIENLRDEQDRYYAERSTWITAYESMIKELDANTTRSYKRRKAKDLRLAEKAAAASVDSDE